MLITAVAALPVWRWLARKPSKRIANVIGMSCWAVVQLLVVVVEPGQESFAMALGIGDPGWIQRLHGPRAA